MLNETKEVFTQASIFVLEEEYQMSAKSYLLLMGVWMIGIAVIYAQERKSEASPKSEVGSDKANPKDAVVGEEKYRTPRAGERLRGTFPLFGFELDIPARDRSKVSALNLGVAVYQPKVGEDAFIPFGAYYYTDSWEEHRRRLRAIFVGVVNYVDFFEGSWNDTGIELTASWENYTLPIPSSLIIEDEELEDSEIYWGYLRAGFGLGWRGKIAPWQFDNNIAIHFLYEPGLLYFDDTKKTAPNYIVPSTTYEDRYHIRLRIDALERNIMELRHSGWAGGIDAIRGHRYNWKDHDFNGSFREKDTQTYYLVSAYVTWAGGPDFLSERHRFITSLYGAFSPDDGLDRYSALRLGGGPSGDESEALSRSPIPGMRFDEFIVSRYLLFSLEYRFELLFFLYLHVKGSIGVLRRMELKDNETEVALSKNEWIGSVGMALTSGFIWDSQIYLEYVSERGMFRGKERQQGHNVMLSWAKSF